METFTKRKRGRPTKVKQEPDLPVSADMLAPRTGFTTALPEIGNGIAEVNGDEVNVEPAGAETCGDITTAEEGATGGKAARWFPKLEESATIREDDAIILDPQDSERQYWTDPGTNLVREIWRPGDGDGLLESDYFEKAGPIPVEDRWRLYQSSSAHPIKHKVNEPPKYVILDDRAAYELRQSDVTQQRLGELWNHDFAKTGKLRNRRPHRGRGAVGDSMANGNDRYHFCSIGTKGEKYYFTGEKDYTPIIYRGEEPAPEPLPKKRKIVPRPDVPLGPRQHGHNQWTRKDLQVKHGAPSFSLNPNYINRMRLKQGFTPEALGLIKKEFSYASTNGTSVKPEDEVSAGQDGLIQSRVFGPAVKAESDENRTLRLECDLAEAQAVITSQKSQIESLQETIAGLQNEIEAVKRGVIGKMTEEELNDLRAHSVGKAHDDGTEAGAYVE